MLVLQASPFEFHSLRVILQYYDIVNVANLNWNLKDQRVGRRYYVYLYACSDVPD